MARDFSFLFDSEGKSFLGIYWYSDSNLLNTYRRFESFAANIFYNIFTNKSFVSDDVKKWIPFTLYAYPFWKI